MAQNIDRLYFSTRIGTTPMTVPFPVAATLKFMQIVPEIAAKFGITEENLMVAPVGGTPLTGNELIMTIEQIVQKYKTTNFELVNRGIVG
jgi:hypothetical protein